MPQTASNSDNNWPRTKHIQVLTFGDLLATVNACGGLGKTRVLQVEDFVMTSGGPINLLPNKRVVQGKQKYHIIMIVQTDVITPLN